MTRTAAFAALGAAVLLPAAAAFPALGQGITVTRQIIMPERENAEELRPFSAEADAMAEVDAALERAAANGTRALVVLGGNWCHDSRSLAWKLATPELEPLIGANYELVYVDVGFLNKNMDVPERFGVEGLEGTPIVLVVEPDGGLVNTDTISSWRTASRRPVSEVESYFSQWVRD